MPRKSTRRNNSSPIKGPTGISKRPTTRSSSRGTRGSNTSITTLMADTNLGPLMPDTSALSSFTYPRKPALNDEKRPVRYTPTGHTMATVDVASREKEKPSGSMFLPPGVIRLRIHGETAEETCQSKRVDQVNARGSDEWDDDKEAQCDACVYLMDDPARTSVVQWNSLDNPNDIDYNSLGKDIVENAPAIYIYVDLDTSDEERLDNQLRMAHRALSHLVTAMNPFLFQKQVYLQFKEPNWVDEGDIAFRQDQMRTFSSIRCQGLTIIDAPPSFNDIVRKLHQEVTSATESLDLFLQLAEIQRLPQVGYRRVYEERLEILFWKALAREVEGFGETSDRLRNAIRSEWQTARARLGEQSVARDTWLEWNETIS